MMVICIGHRGAKGYEVENTLASFEKALELGVDMIELDVRVCRCGTLVVMHDNKMNRTSNGKGTISKRSYGELKCFTVNGEPLLTLNKALNFINRKVKINIELKDKGTAKPVFHMIENFVHKKGWHYDDFLISSFNHKELEIFRELNPDARIGVLVRKKVITRKRSIHYLDFAKKINAYSIHPSTKVANKGFVIRAHERDMKVFVYTANKYNEIAKLIDMGVDGIFSDYPDRVSS